MDSLQKNFIVFSVCLKSTLVRDLSGRSTWALTRLMSLLRTLENIQVLDRPVAQNMLVEKPPGVKKNLFACAAFEESQMLFFNISGSEFIEMYVSGGISNMRKFFEWFGTKQNKQALG